MNSSATTLTPTTPAALGIFWCGSLIYRDGGQHIEAATMKERWKECNDGNYEVSDAGRVRRARPGRGRTYVGRIMKPTRLNFGHLAVSFWIDGCRKPHLVHRLVAEAFIGPCPDGLEVNHKDGDPANNCVSNLEYVTHAENIRHGYRNKRGERHHCAKLTDDAVIDIRKRMAVGERGVDLAREYCCSSQLVYDIANRGHRS